MIYIYFYFTFPIRIVNSVLFFMLVIEYVNSFKSPENVFLSKFLYGRDVFFRETNSIMTLLSYCVISDLEASDVGAGFN